MSDEKQPTPLETARQLIQDDRKRRVEAFRAGVKELQGLHRCQLIPMPGQPVMDGERNIIIPAGTVEVVLLD